MLKIKTNLKSSALAMAALCSSGGVGLISRRILRFARRQKSGLDLKRAVKAVAASHRTISYGTSTWSAFRSTDVKDRERHRLLVGHVQLQPCAHQRSLTE